MVDGWLLAIVNKLCKSYFLLPFTTMHTRKYYSLFCFIFGVGYGSGGMYAPIDTLMTARYGLLPV